MRLMAHIAKLVWEVLCYGAAQRRLTLILAVAIGLVFLALGLASQAVAPVAFYPFA